MFILTSVFIFARPPTFSTSGGDREQSLSTLQTVFAGFEHLALSTFGTNYCESKPPFERAQGRSGVRLASGSKPPYPSWVPRGGARKQRSGAHVAVKRTREKRSRRKKERSAEAMTAMEKQNVARRLRGRRREKLQTNARKPCEAQWDNIFRRTRPKDPWDEGRPDTFDSLALGTTSGSKHLTCLFLGPNTARSVRRVWSLTTDCWMLRDAFVMFFLVVANMV